MDSSADTFGAGVESPADDPFAEDEFEQEDPLAGEDSIPVVDKEGRELSAQEVEALAEARRMDEEAAAAAEPEQEATAPEQTEEVQFVEDAVAEEQTPEANGVVESDPTQAASPASEATPASSPATPSSPATADAAAPATSPGDGGPTSASATDDTPDAEVPEEVKDKKGVVTQRRYLIFQPDGDGKWREVHWYEKDGKIVKQGTPGAKKQKICVARGQEEALAVGFAAIGQPQDGAPLVAVASTYWQVRHVAPEPIAPTRQRLQIR